MSQLGHGRKKQNDTSGAPFPPAANHTDGPEHPSRSVPTTDEPVPDEAPKPEEEEGQ